LLVGFDTLSWNVLLAAVTVAVVHTAIGPDHYLPFVMIARARRWTVRRTLLVTAVCGLGHVASSLLLGLLGLLVGAAMGSIEALEAQRAELAGWALVAFGTAYGLWGLRRYLRCGRGVELHEHGAHLHLHRSGDRAHHHRHPTGPDVSFWALFAVFVLGPCEPLIPLFILPASQGRWGLAMVAAAVFGVVTVTTMLVLTVFGLAGLRRIRFDALEAWAHPLAGTVIASSGLAVLFLGL
jgi:hypothetical protein